MSRHLLHLMHQGRKLTVVAGYDRPLRELYLHVIHDNDADHRVGSERNHAAAARRVLIRNGSLFQIPLPPPNASPARC
ncbi:MAG: hypothetical protein JSR49_02980 [Proteobacteria bacterium]|nr:hypothetical protein [Pseudomonadota bacterium]